MARRDIFTDADIRQIEAHGLTAGEALRQLDIFKNPAPYLKLVRPCTKGDGIRVIEEEMIQELIARYENQMPERRCLKFVPASGAASRMFKALLGELNKGKDILRESVENKARTGQQDRQELLKFINNTRRFAFFQDLKSVLSNRGLQIDILIEEGRFTDVIRFLLAENGLNYANLPKGLLKFHEYVDGSRTAFEEHLVEAVSYVADQEGPCHLHFAVSPEHMEKFRALLKKIKPAYEKKYPVVFKVDFSVQKQSTDTIAVDPDNNPFRDEKGRLLFRPGGHGSLIENVNDLDVDIIFLKNIDNVVPDRLKSETFKWKKILGGYLITLQTEIHGYLENLSSGDADESLLAEAMTFMNDELCYQVPDAVAIASFEEKKAFLMERLNRPIRICGMVRNEGEPGGGPFWVQDETGEVSLQIVETAQIDPDSREQQDILESSTHFNSVDLVCGVRDWQGRPIDLRNYIDEKAVFISQKSKDGKGLKALEHPGLWNGAMGRWITIFVEVPIITFNPVKAVNDLLRKEHQPG